jgi:hypothetical protein
LFFFIWPLYCVSFSSQIPHLCPFIRSL